MMKIFQNTSRKSLLIVILLPFVLLSSTEQLPSAEVAVSASFMKKLTRLPIEKTEDLDTTLNRTRIVTRINVNGQAYIQPWQTGKDGLGMCILASNAIHSDIDATISAPGQIFVHSDAVANTNASSNKCFFLNIDGLKTFPAATSAATKLTVKNLDVWAGGLFKRIKERLGRAAAERAMAKQIPQNEREISNRAVKTINDLFDSLAAPMVKKANSAWKDWARDATLNTKLIPHPPKFLTTKTAAHIVVPSSDGPNQMELSPKQDEALLVKIRPKYIRDIAKTYLSDFTFSDMELLHLIMNPSGDATTPDDIIGSEEDIVVTFVGDVPVDVTMKNQMVTLSANFSTVATRGKTYQSISMHVQTQITAGANGLSIVLPEALEVVNTATGERHEELSKIFTDRWSMVVTGKREFNIEGIRKAYASWIPLRVTNIDANNDSLTITSVNGSEDEFTAINKKLAEMLGL